MLRRLRLEIILPRMLKTCLVFGLYFTLLFRSISVVAQDSQYWNLQYGTKATLLGGAVIGSVSDLSATYYNPGAVSLREPKLILSAKVYEYDWIKIENGAGANRDLTSQKLVLPLISLLLKSSGTQRVGANWRFQY